MRNFIAKFVGNLCPSLVRNAQAGIGENTHRVREVLLEKKNAKLSMISTNCSKSIVVRERLAFLTEFNHRNSHEPFGEL